jgi:hypothetical protein
MLWLVVELLVSSAHSISIDVHGQLVENKHI